MPGSASSSATSSGAWARNASIFSGVRVLQDRVEVAARATSVESGIPARCWTSLPGSQQAPPEYAEVPPISGVFSRTTVDRPAFAASAAPVRAPPPEPTTTTSYTAGSVTGGSSQVERVLASPGSLGEITSRRR